MKKLTILLPFACLLLSSCGCSKNTPVIDEDNKVNEEEPSIIVEESQPFRYTPLEEELIVVDQDGLEVFEIEVIDIPRDGIKACSWDDYDIKLRVHYNDGSTQDYPFKEKHIPLASRHYLGELGHHNIEIIVNGHTAKFGFDIFDNPDFHGYNVQFVNSRTSEVIYEDVVGYYKNARYPGVLPEDKVVDEEHISRFAHWDYPLEYVHQDMVYTTVFRNEEKRLYGDIPMDGGPILIKQVKQDYEISALVYLGRVHNAPVYASEVHQHTQGETGETIGFRAISNYSNDWNHLNESILNNAIQYQYNPTYNSYLYGSNGPFTNNPNFLSNFETIYDPIYSRSVHMDDGLLIDTSISEPYDNCYNKARSYLTYTKDIQDNDETGYYRIAVTCHFDIYTSMTFKSMGNGKYAFVGNAKWVYAPVLQKATVSLEFSEQADFVNTFAKKVTFSNEQLYNIANELDWGN